MDDCYDLVAATTLTGYDVEETKAEIEKLCRGVAPAGASESERWKIAKSAFYGSPLGVISEWGLIDFDPSEHKRLVGGENLSYDEYLEAQKRSRGHVRTYFEKSYYDAASVSFKGKIKRINTTKRRICFESILVNGMYAEGDWFCGKEDHVWMELSGFEDFRVGDCLSFYAEVYRYVKIGGGHGKTIDFALRNPDNVKKIEEYELPSDGKLYMQDIDQMLCEVCFVKEKCNGCFCLNEKWKNSMMLQLLAMSE